MFESPTDEEFPVLSAAQLWQEVRRKRQASNMISCLRMWIENPFFGDHFIVARWGFPLS